MIPDIGLMIGCYIIVRMISFYTRKGERSESKIVRGLAVATIIITMLCLIDLLSRGAEPTRLEFILF